MTDRLMREVEVPCHGETSCSRALLSRLTEDDISFVFDQLLYEGEVEESDVKDLEREFKRFFFLVSTSRQPMAMIAPLIDKVWHQFVLFTEKYGEFCMRNAGFFVHHRPDTAATPVPVEAGENFLRAYEAEFGSMPAIWWKGMSLETRAFYEARPLQGRPPIRWSGWTGELPGNGNRER